MRYIFTLFLTLCLASIFVANQKTTNFDSEVDFSTIKSFAIGEVKSRSTLPELNNLLLLQRVGDSIRAQLTAKGLRETSSSPDVLMNCHVDDVYYDGPGRNPQRGLGGTGPVQGIVVVDMVHRESSMLIWQGTYRDNEDNGSKVARNLPSDVSKLLAQYPPKRRSP